MRSIVLAAAAMLLVACAGTNFDFAAARQVKPGMSEAELTALMGRPYSVVSRGDSQTWIWSHATGFGAAKSISFMFRDGKVVEVPKIPDSFR